MTTTLVTIDSLHTRDIDDAVFVERRENNGYRVLVAIANAAAHVRIGSTEDLEAARLGATAYAGEHIVHRMLPSKISEGEGSLVAGVPRRALVAEILLDASLDVEQCSFSSQTVTVHARLSYEELPDILASKVHPLHSMMTLAAAMGKLLLARRREQGALALYDLTRLLVTDEDGQFVQMHSKGETIGYIVVQELMILNNRLMAKYFAENDILGLFRNHEPRAAAPAPVELAKTLEGWMLAPAFSEVVIRDRLAMISTRSRYEAYCKGHYALNLPAYMHSTSPLRRYADLVNQRQLLAHLKGAPPPYDKNALAQIGECINESMDRRKQERSDGFKQSVRNVASKALDRGRLERLADHELVAALKVGREAAYLPDILSDEVVRRMQAEALTDKVAVALISDVPRELVPSHLVAAFAEWIGRHPEKSPGLLQHGEVTGIYARVAVVSKEAGTGAGGFIAQASMKVGDLALAVKGTGARKRDAEQAAAARLLCQAFGGDLPESSDASGAGSAQAVNAKGQLLELCQKRKWPQPEFVMMGKGPSNAMVFSGVVTLRVDGAEHRAAVDGARTKREAEALASEKLLQQLEAAKSEARAATVVDNAVGALMELCQKRKLAAPDVQFQQITETPPLFRCDIAFGASLPEFGSCSGAGQTKKEAKQAAAKLAIEKLQRFAVPA